MNLLAYVWANVWLTLLRVLPVPCRTGVEQIGNPGRNAPVLLTGNYRLTVVRVKRALRGIDAWLLIANSRGVNVWCAATGGHLNHHDVVSVLKTSGIESRVDHRELILPQLAATGIEARVIHEKTGWRVHWGPVEAADVPDYLRHDRQKTAATRDVGFPWPRRVEMAVAWAFPISLLALLLVPIWPGGVLPVMGLVWILSLAMFLSFPLFAERLREKAEPMGWVFFDFGAKGVLLVVWGIFLLLLLGYAVLTGESSWVFFTRWALSSLAVVLILGLDLTGSTPTYKSGLHPDRRLRIALDMDRCEGAGCCEDVCPVSVFEVDREGHTARLPGIDKCVQCGACIVQCPCDALLFSDSAGRIVTPESVRRFKLNLLGKRTGGSLENPHR